jgi:hypothetical protein
LWELPSIELGANAGSDGIEAALRRLLGHSIRCQGLVAVVERSLTHRNLQLNTMLVTSPSKPKVIDGYEEIRWATIELAAKIGMSAAMAEVLRTCAASLEQTSANNLRPARTAVRLNSCPRKWQ